MEKTLLFVASNEAGTVVSAIGIDEKVYHHGFEFPQTYSVKLPENKGILLAKERGLKSVVVSNSNYLKFSNDEHLIKFFGFRYVGKQVNSVLFCEAESFEILESEVI